MKQVNRICCASLVILFFAGCFSGCMEEVIVTENVPSYGTYRGQSIPLPECQYAEDMVMLEEGRLRVALKEPDNSVFVCTSDLDRNNWSDIWDVPKEILATGEVANIALSPDGSIFLCTQRIDDTGCFVYHFWVVEKNGAYHEIFISIPEVDYATKSQISDCDFTSSGKLIVQFYTNAIFQVDLETGAVGDNLNEMEQSIIKMGCAGESVYFIGCDSVSANINDKSVSLENTMGQHLIEAIQVCSGHTPAASFWEHPEGYLFFITQKGLFCFVPGGSVVEEIISGSQLAEGDFKFLPAALAGVEDDSFYVLGNQVGGEAVLLHFIYDAETSAFSHLQPI